MNTDCGWIPYPNAASAWRAVQRLRQRPAGYRVIAQQCPNCRQWHLNKQPDPKPHPPAKTRQRRHWQWLMQEAAV